MAEVSGGGGVVTPQYFSQSAIKPPHQPIDAAPSICSFFPGEFCCQLGADTLNIIHTTDPHTLCTL